MGGSASSCKESQIKGSIMILKYFGAPFELLSTLAYTGSFASYASESGQHCLLRELVDGNQLVLLDHTHLVVPNIVVKHMHTVRVQDGGRYVGWGRKVFHFVVIVLDLTVDC